MWARLLFQQTIPSIKSLMAKIKTKLPVNVIKVTLTIEFWRFNDIAFPPVLTINPTHLLPVNHCFDIFQHQVNKLSLDAYVIGHLFPTT